MPDVSAAVEVINNLLREHTFDGKLKVYAKSFSLLNPGEFRDKTQTDIPFCVCKTCQERFSAKEKLLLQELAKVQLAELIKTLYSDVAFDKKLAAWIFHFPDSSERSITIGDTVATVSLKPSNAEEIRQANQAFYEIRKRSIFDFMPIDLYDNFYGKDFESRKVFWQYRIKSGIASSVEMQIARLYLEYNKSILAYPSVELLDSLLNGATLEWDTHIWDDVYTTKVVFAYEAYLYIQFLHGK